jgi:hypothetical protein
MRQTIVVLLLALGAAAPAAAQGLLDRVWVTVDGGVQAAPSHLTDAFTIDEFVETGTVKADYPAKAATLFGGSVGIRVWKQLGAGVAITQTSSRGEVAIDARIPHPFFDNQLRPVEGSESIKRSETAAHVEIAYLLDVNRNVRVILSAGPSFFSVDQPIVTAVHYSEQYPYDMATFTRAETIRASKSAAGFHAAADAFWMFTRTIGAGGIVRVSRATVDADAGTGRTISVEAGGVQAGVGLRLVF